MPVPDHFEFFIDPNRCIGCQACVQACGECDTHKGRPMIHLEYVERSESTQTAPVICMHCDSPTCAEVCPADAIKKTGDGVVQSARKPRCIACNNCVIACPFGVPKMQSDFELMMKCDMCYDRTSVGKKPMCATVCPSGALYFGTRDHVKMHRQRSQPINTFQFGNQTITTKVNMMVPAAPGSTPGGAPGSSTANHIDVTSAMHDEAGPAKRVRLNVLDDSLFQPEPDVAEELDDAATTA